MWKIIVTRLVQDELEKSLQSEKLTNLVSITIVTNCTLRSVIFSSVIDTIMATFV